MITAGPKAHRTPSLDTAATNLAALDAATAELSPTQEAAFLHHVLGSLACEVPAATFAEAIHAAASFMSTVGGRLP